MDVTRKNLKDSLYNESDVAAMRDLTCHTKNKTGSEIQV